MKVKFLPQDVEYEIEPNQTIMDLALSHGIKIGSVCNGLPSCAECRVKVHEGDYNLLPPTKKELNLIGTGYFIDQRRLACQLTCYGDVTIDLSEQEEKGEIAEHKRPQGTLRKDDSEESLAVTGSLLEQNAELLEEVAKDEKKHDERGRSRPQKNQGPRQGRKNKSKNHHRR